MEANLEKCSRSVFLYWLKEIVNKMQTEKFNLTLGKKTFECRGGVGDEHCYTVLNDLTLLEKTETFLVQKMFQLENLKKLEVFCSLMKLYGFSKKVETFIF